MRRQRLRWRIAALIPEDAVGDSATQKEPVPHRSGFGTVLALLA